MAPGLSEMDLYEVLGVLPDVDVSEIKKVYRKKALTCHPDKNPDNPRAASEWEDLSKALEILADSEARAAYDKVLRAKKANELRNRTLDSKRRKVKEDLETREAAFRDGQDGARGKDAAQQLQQVIKRLQEEGSQILAEEQRLLKEELKKDINQTQGEDEPSRLKIKWKSKKTDDSNGGYNYSILYRTLQKYGAITNLLLSSKKKGSAVVEFGSTRAAKLAAKNERGFSSNPLELSWLSGKPEEPPASTESSAQQSTNSTETDFEFLVLQKLKKSAEQQKRSNQQKEGGNAEESTFQDGFQSNTFATEIRGSENSDADPQCLRDESPRMDKNKGSLSLDDSESTEEKSEPKSGLFVTSSGGAKAKDYESLVLMRMRQTAERQRLIEQMARDDAEDS